MMEYSLRAIQISKQFTSGRSIVRAVRDLSFDLRPGESVAFLGPNGAGKSTTIKMLCGILMPSSGRAEIAGLPAGSLEANRQLGLVFGTRSQLYMHMTVNQCLDLIAEIYFLTGVTKRKRIAELAELFSIKDLLPARVRTLSLGQRMRCEVVAALIHKPKVLLADEPTIGLDVIAKNSLRELIQRWLEEEKSTLLLTSHDLSDVEALCERCILIDHGEKKYDGKLESLRGDLTHIRRIQVTVAHTQIKKLATDPRLHGTSDSDFVHGYELQTTAIPMNEAIAKLSQHYGEYLQDIQIANVSLEEVLAHRYKVRP